MTNKTNEVSCRHHGVTLTELLLVVAVMGVLTLVSAAPVGNFLTTGNDLNAVHQVVEMISHARSMGLTGRSDAAISFQSGSSAISLTGTNYSLPAGYLVANLKIGATGVANLSIRFTVNGNIICNESMAALATLEVRRGGEHISTVSIPGMEIPIPSLH